MLDAPGLLSSSGYEPSDFHTSEEPLGFFVPWRLSGLLSGYLPTDTRPQARAKLGKTGNRLFESASQRFFWVGDKFAQHALAAPLLERASSAEHERMLSLFNEA